MKQLRDLADFIYEFHVDAAPEEVIEAAKLCVLDSVCAGIGASQGELIQALIKQFCGIDGNRDAASLWGNDKRIPLRTAAFLNGMMGHVLELDDVHSGSKTHIGTVVVPASWALGEELGCSGKDLIEAVICGYETMARIGKGFGVSSHRNKGWHVTGTAGTFGAAAACSKLLRLDKEQITSAFGLAGTQSCGTWAFLPDGTTNKILHSGRAAVSGLDAALLSQAGMTGPSHILDSEDGALYPAMSDGYCYGAVSENLGTVYEIQLVDKKPYPCCRSTHCAIEGTSDLCRRYAIAAEEVEKVLIKTYRVGVKQCAESQSSRDPLSPSEAKFSTQYTVACALLNNTVSRDDFLPEILREPERRKLLKRIFVEEEARYTKAYPEHWGCMVTISCKNGSSYSVEVPDAAGSKAKPMSRESVIHKAGVLINGKSQEYIMRTMKSILHLERMPALPRL